MFPPGDDRRHDHDVVEAQLGRPVRPPIEVAARCHLGLATVVRVPAVLDDGTPFPTRYWLTCPVHRRRVSALESDGMVREFQQRREEDASFAEQCRHADEAYTRDRDGSTPDGWTGPRPSGGVGGSAGGVKCLHAHLAHHLAGGDNPIGREVAALIGCPGCEEACVSPVARRPG